MKKLTYNQEMSLEKHHNRHILLKTEAKGFFIDSGEEKNDFSKKSTESSLQSQLPFLLYTHQLSDQPQKSVLAAQVKRKILAPQKNMNSKQFTHK